jgi:hypothetical protein
MYITFGDFTLLGHFYELFEALTSAKRPWQAALDSP